MSIVAGISMFSSCTTDEPYTENANKCQAENGASTLRPSLPIYVSATGFIKGIYSPAMDVQVRATNSQGTHYYSGVVINTSEFFIRSVPPGTYTVTITPMNQTFQPILVPDVVVKARQTSHIGVVNF